MPSYSIQNPPDNLTMNDVKAVSTKYEGLAKSSRYAVRIVPVGSLLTSLGYGDFLRDFTYLSDSAEMPGRAFMSVDVRYYGPNFKLPFQSQYEDMSITFLCRTQSFERQFFDDWMEIINPTNLWDFNYRDSYKAKIEIFQLAMHGETTSSGAGRPDTPATAPKPTYKWTVWDAYPVTINPQPVTWADDNIQRLSIGFTYTKWTREGRDTTPGSFRDNFIQGSEVIGLGQIGAAAAAPLPLPGSGSTGGGSTGGGFGGGGGGGF